MAVREKSIRKSRRMCEASFTEFVQQAWSVVEPNDLIWGWHMTAICLHLEAVRDGDISRMLINVPPGMSKSMLTSVLWPAWCWTTDPSLRFLCCSHSLDLALRDSVRCRRLLQSEWYQERWPLKLVGDQNAKGKYENDHNGFRQAVAAGSVTGARADHFIIDDPHSVESAASEAMRRTTTDWFLEAVPTRMNNPAPVYDGNGNMVKPASSIVIIMQRLHENDVSGICLEKNLGYEHLCLPMEFEEDRRCETSIGFADQRTYEGELLFPERFPPEVVERDKRVMGPFASSGQLQQRPSPRGGGIIQRSWWQLYDDDEAASQGLNSGKSYPDMDYIIASLDTAYTEKQENDASYLTIWGIWQRGGSSARAILTNKGERVDLVDDRDTIPCAMLMHAKEMRLHIHGAEILRKPGEPDYAFKAREKESWGLVEWTIHMCNQFKVDTLLVESKASGLSVAQEIKRLNRNNTWSVQLINPGNADKVARAYAVQASFSNSQIWSPDRDWADKVITQCEVFPKGKHDDAVDSTTQAIRYLRERGFLTRQEDILAGASARASYKKPSKPLYDI